MFKRELKINLKSFLLWSGILAIVFIVVFAIYPSLVQSENMNSINELLEVFPPEILKAFNMDLSGIDTAFGWLKSEGFMFIMIGIGAYSGILGSSIVLKEESDKTIEYLNSLPVTRKQIMIEKIKCALLYILGIIFIVGLVNYICLVLSGDFDQKQYLLLAISPLFPSLVFFAVNLLISTYNRKTRNTFGISLGIVLVSYILQIISQMGEKVEFMKYFSIYTLADTRSIIESNSFNSIYIFITIILTVGCIVLAIQHYLKKDLV